MAREVVAPPMLKQGGVLAESVSWIRRARQVVPRQDRAVLLSPPRLVARFLALRLGAPPRLGRRRVRRRRARARPRARRADHGLLRSVRAPLLPPPRRRRRTGAGARPGAAGRQPQRRAGPLRRLLHGARHLPSATVAERAMLRAGARLPVRGPAAPLLRAAARHAARRQRERAPRVRRRALSAGLSRLRPRHLPRVSPIAAGWCWAAAPASSSWRCASACRSCRW